ncbi:MAG: BCCT family transporter [Gemmatimonadota bacterium]|nr:BCCT family transporter [Gemmatimonadota bacterium]
MGQGAPRYEVDRFIFVATAVLLLAVSVPLMVAPVAGEAAVQATFDFITGNFGVVYIWAAVINLGFLSWLAFGRYGHVRLSNDDSPPEFSTFSWVSMLFCAGIGTGILYWGTVEWAYYFEAPPFGVEPRSVEAIEWATSYPIFHWGITGWAFYCLPALAIGHAYFCRGMPSMRLSDNCRAVIGDRTDGPLGKVIDLLFMLGLLGAAGTGIGLAVPLISNGLSELLAIPDSFGLSVVVVLVVTAVFAASVYVGLERGIRRLSNLNVVLTLALLVFVLVAGPTLFILKTGTNSLGHVLQNFVRMNSWTEPIGETGFVETWTIFYWAWWIALGPYMGMFVARISRGRSIREITLGMLAFGTAGCALFFIVFGNYALHLELTEALSVTSILQDEGAPQAIIAVVQSLPLAPVVLALFCLVCLVFMATTYDSAAYTLALGASRRLEVGQDPPRWHRLFWAFGIGVLPITLMFLGGLTPFQTASVVVSLPLIAVGVLMAVSLVRSLREDQAETTRP